MKMRNSHLIIEMSKAKEFKRFSLLMNQKKKSNFCQSDEIRHKMREWNDKITNSIPSEENIEGEEIKEE